MSNASRKKACAARQDEPSPKLAAEAAPTGRGESISAVDNMLGDSIVKPPSDPGHMGASP